MYSQHRTRPQIEETLTALREQVGGGAFLVQAAAFLGDLDTELTLAANGVHEGAVTANERLGALYRARDATEAARLAVTVARDLAILALAVEVQESGRTLTVEELEAFDG